MRTCRISVVLLTCCWLGCEAQPAKVVQAPSLALPKTAERNEHSSDWRPLFNGEDLTGWQHLGGGRMRVEAGLLILENDAEHQPGYLVTASTARNFEVRFRCRILDGDSGIFYRSRRDPRTPTTILGPQVQLNRASGRGLGGIYETQGRGWLARPTMDVESKFAEVPEWLDGELTVQGDRVKVVLNGSTTVDFVDPAPANLFREAGHFALQVHGGGLCRVEFARVKVRVLD